MASMLNSDLSPEKKLVYSLAYVLPLFIFDSMLRSLAPKLGPYSKLP